MSPKRGRAVRGYSPCAGTSYVPFSHPGVDEASPCQSPPGPAQHEPLDWYPGWRPPESYEDATYPAQSPGAPPGDPRAPLPIRAGIFYSSRNVVGILIWPAYATRTSAAWRACSTWPFPNSRRANVGYGTATSYPDFSNKPQWPRSHSGQVGLAVAPGSNATSPRPAQAPHPR